jgi:biofilm PGA synthesis protein PgaA
VPVDTAYASSMRARGWPRKAEQELRGALSIDPRDSGAMGERAGALLEMREYRGAEAALAEGRAASAEDQRVMRAGRLWEVHNMNELSAEVGYGRSSGGPTGNRDFELDATLYSRPLSYNYRAFAHLYSAQGQFDTGTGRYDRAGVGLQYRSARYVASAELAHDINRERPAVSGALAYTPDDFWTFAATAESDTMDTPLQARLAGVTAWRIGASATWRANESRRASLAYGHLRFSDGNERDGVAARWTERVIAGPVYKLEVTGSLAASRNSNTTAVYFNPTRDTEAGVELANEWLQWRRYERAFRHRVIVSAGTYHQDGFGSGPVYGARYEQEWSADDRLVLRYGIGRSLHPYDGVRTGRSYLYAAVNWRF